MVYTLWWPCLKKHIDQTLNPKKVKGNYILSSLDTNFNGMLCISFVRFNSCHQYSNVQKVCQLIQNITQWYQASANYLDLGWLVVYNNQLQKRFPKWLSIQSVFSEIIVFMSKMYKDLVHTHPLLSKNMSRRQVNCWIRMLT